MAMKLSQGLEHEWGLVWDDYVNKVFIDEKGATMPSPDPDSPEEFFTLAALVLGTPRQWDKEYFRRYHALRVEAVPGYPVGGSVDPGDPYRFSNFVRWVEANEKRRVNIDPLHVSQAAQDAMWLDERTREVYLPDGRNGEPFAGKTPAAIGEAIATWLRGNKA